jgi:vancomycin permeability regulator SanA
MYSPVYAPAPEPPSERTQREPRRRKSLRVRRWFLIFVLLTLAAFAAIERMAQTEIQAVVDGHIYPTVDSVPSRPVALVFGAGIRPGGKPSLILEDRIQTAVDLYKAEKVRKILMTGDNGSLDYNEVAVMRRTAIKMGVPGRDVVKDHAGFRTYDSCYRARDVFEVKSAILVTQAFHLPRAVYLARSMGLDAVGVTADGRPYAAIGNYSWRERLACAWSWVEINVTRPLPRYLGPKLPVMDDKAAG